MPLPDFSLLSPSDILDAVEGALGRPVDASLTACSSYINRVYQLTDSDGRRIVAKFYRPGRWNEAAIREEHEFAAECAVEGLPAIVPLRDGDGETLNAIVVEDESGLEHPYFFALYPWISRPGWEPETTEQWLDLGRVVAGFHRIGERESAPSRERIGVECTTRPALSRLIGSGLIHPDIRGEFGDLCNKALDRLARNVDGLGALRVHGDLHRGNLLTGECGPEVIDFDDMAMGPAVQDLWLLLPGRLDEARAELNLLLEGYGEIRSFDRDELEAVEPLRLMRMIGYLDWQARQRSDDGFSRAFGEDWGSRSFWIKELEDLRDQARECGVE